MHGVNRQETPYGFPKSTNARKAGGLDFPPEAGERQKHIRALTLAVETGCSAPGLKQPIRAFRDGLAEKRNMSQPAVSLCVQRGERIHL